MARKYARIFGSLGNHDGDCEDNVNKMKLNLEHSDQFGKNKNKNLAVVVHVFQTTQDLVISRRCFAEDEPEPEANNCFSIIFRGEYQEMQNNKKT